MVTAAINEHVKSFIAAAKVDRNTGTVDLTLGTLMDERDPPLSAEFSDASTDNKWYRVLGWRWLWYRCEAAVYARTANGLMLAGNTDVNLWKLTEIKHRTAARILTLILGIFIVGWLSGGDMMRKEVGSMETAVEIHSIEQKVGYS
jgi:hypothetical protein